jgi:hypothetical protein
VAFVALEAAYLVAMNVFLSTPLFAKVIDADPMVVDIHYARAWSFYPPHVHAKGLTIRATDSHVEWILALDEVTFDFSPLGLARKQFHVTRARGSGISFRVRMKVPPGTSPEQTRWLPPVDSLGPVGVVPPARYPGTWDDARWDLWTIRLEDIVADHVREVWVDGGLFAGDARIAGGFYLRPIREVDVGPIEVDVHEGSTTFDGKTLAEPITGRFDFRLHGFDPRTISDQDLVHRIDLSADATVVVPSLRALPVTLPARDSVDGRVEVPRLAVRVVEGIVRDGTDLEARAARVRATIASHAVSSAVAVRASVDHARLAVAGELDGVTSDVGVSAPHVTLTADSAALDLAAPLTDLHGVIDVPEALAPDAARLAARTLPHAPVRVAHGSLRASARVEAWREGARATLEARADATHLALAGRHGPPALAIDRASLSASSPRFTPSDPLAHLQLAGTVSGGRLSDPSALADVLPRGVTLTSAPDARFDADASAKITAHVARAAGSVHARGFGLSAPKLHASGDLDAVANVPRLDLAHGTLTGDVRVVATGVTGGFEPSAPAPELTADRIDARASVRDLTLAHARPADVDFALDVDRARLHDARALNAFLPYSSIVAIESGSATLSAHVDTARDDRAGAGSLRVWLPGVGVRLHETHLAGDLAVEVQARARDREHGEIDLGGSRVALRNVRVTDSAANTSAWAGDVVLQEGTLRLDPTPRLAGSVTVQARDASPVLAVLLRGSVPALLAKLARMPHLSAATDLVVEPDALLVANLVASGSDLSVQGTYGLQDATRRAAFVVQKGPVSAGIRLDDDGAHVHLFGLRGWYAEQRREALGVVGCALPSELAVEGCLMR